MASVSFSAARPPASNSCELCQAAMAAICSQGTPASVANATCWCHSYSDRMTTALGRIMSFGRARGVGTRRAAPTPSRSARRAVQGRGLALADVHRDRTLRRADSRGAPPGAEDAYARVCDPCGRRRHCRPERSPPTVPAWRCRTVALWAGVDPSDRAGSARGASSLGVAPETSHARHRQGLGLSGSGCITFGATAGRARHVPGQHASSAQRVVATLSGELPARSVL